MSYENDRYRDEDGEPLMDFDEDVQSDGDEPQQNFLDDDVGYDRRERSPTPVYNASDSKPRKRLIKKSSSSKESGGLVDFGSDDDVGDEDGVAGVVRENYSDGGKWKNDRGEKLKSLERKRKGERVETQMKSRKGGEERMRNHVADRETKEMWDTVAGGDSEEDHDGVRTLDDENFIDDTGVDPAHVYGSDNEHSPSRAPEAEEGEEDEMKDLFKMGRKKKKTEKSAAEIALLVENVMAELEVVAEEDAELNRQRKPAINKLKKLSLLENVLSKKQLQQEFLDHGVLTLLKNWLEPLPDKSLPNINIRAAVLKILNDFPIDLEQYDRREQLKRSGLGKVVMFLSKTNEETTSNRKLAKELVDKWSRPIFNKSTRFEDMKNFEEERALRRPPAKKAMSKASRMSSRDDDLDLTQFSQGSGKSGASSSGQHASRPEAMCMDFMVRPKSKVDPDDVRNRAKQVVQDQRRVKMNKKLQQLKAPKRKQLQATKLSVEGRGMVKYL